MQASFDLRIEFRRFLVPKRYASFWFILALVHACEKAAFNFCSAGALLRELEANIGEFLQTDALKETAPGIPEGISQFFGHMLRATTGSLTKAAAQSAFCLVLTDRSFANCEKQTKLITLVRSSSSARTTCL